MNRHCGKVALVIVAIVLSGIAAFPATASHVASTSPAVKDHGARLVLPLMNTERGKKLFVSKGCVACHAINGVGGHDAPALDAHQMDPLMNPFDFAAKMWNHAPSMIAAQEGALGQMITMTGQELADIIGFCHDDEAQHAFSEKDLTAAARKMMHHEHGGKPAERHHGPEIGHPVGATTGGHHPHSPGTAPHKD